MDISRDPSIHIRLSHFTKIIEEMGLSVKEFHLLMSEVRKFSCDNRSVVVTNEKLKKDTQRLSNSNKGDASLLSDIIYSVRIKLKHRGINKIKESDRDWLNLKELTKLINEFCLSFNLDKRMGYIEYITIAFSKISSMHSYISKFITMYESICLEYEAKVILNSDTTPGKTKAIHDDYVSLISSKTGILEDFTTKPIKMLCFFKIKKKCEELNIEPETWIDAQFEALDYCNGLPSPENMASEKALERLNKYMYENKIKITKPKSDVKNDFWSKLKKYGEE